MSIQRTCLALVVGIWSSASAFAQFGQSNFGSFGNSQTGGQQQAGTGQAGQGTGGIGDLSFTPLGGGNFGNFDGSFGASQIASDIVTGGAFAQGVARSNAALGLSGVGGLGGGFGLGGFGLGGFGGGFGRGGFNNQNNRNNNEPAVRAVVRLGFSTPAVSTSARTEQVNERLSRIPFPGRLQSRINVVMDGRTAVLRGEVASQADGELVARLLSLEPGVDEIRNELVVASTPEAVVPGPPPPASSLLPSAGF